MKDQINITILDYSFSGHGCTLSPRLACEISVSGCVGGNRACSHEFVLGHMRSNALLARRVLDDVIVCSSLRVVNMQCL